MGKVRSARGVLVDFDLLKVKEDIANSEVPIAVKNRQDFIDRRLRRRIKTATTKLDVEKVKKETEQTNDVTESKVDQTSNDNQQVENETTEVEEQPKVIKQKARTKRKE